MTKAEEKHINNVGLHKFEAVVARALYRLKLDDKLRSAIKLRESLAYEMALRSTGFTARALSLATKQNEKRFGVATREMQDICDRYLNEASE